MSVAISWANKMQLAKCDIMVGFCKSSHNFYQHHKHVYRSEGWGVVGAMKWQVTAEFNNFQGKMAHKEALLHLNCYKII